MAWKGKRPTAFADTIERDVGKKTRAAALQALTGVIERSPVGDPTQWKSKPPPGYIGGTFRGNNRVSIGSRDNTFDPSAIDKNGASAFAAGSNVLSRVSGAPFTTIYIQNNLPYARRIEDGWSGQSPRGVYAITYNSLVEASR